MRTFALVLLLAAPAFPQFRAGAAKRTVTPNLARHKPLYLAGFGQNRLATGIHDDLWARCLALIAGQDKPLIVCGVDSIGLFFADVARIRISVASKLGSEANLVVAALHDHEAPDTMGMWGPKVGVSGINESYNGYVVARTAEAAVEAMRTARPARARLASARKPELDAFINDNRPPNVHDSELVMLSVRDLAGKPVATLVNWANHPETLGSGNTLITSDYSNYVYSRLEELEGGIAVFVNGAVGGMQSPLGVKIQDPETGAAAEDNSFRKAEILGRTVAEIASAALKNARAAAIDAILYRERAVTFPVANEDFILASQAGIFKGRKEMRPNGGSVTAPAGYARLSERGKPVLEIAMAPGELYPELSVGGIERYQGADFPDAPLEPAIKPMMKAPYKMLFGLANDEIGYVIPKAEWDYTAPWLQNAPDRWYGEVNSMGPEAAPLLAAAFRELIRGK